MRPPSTGPDIRRYNANDDWTMCPECHNGTLRLDSYEIQKSSESPDVDVEWYEFVIWGWWAIAVNFLSDLMTYEGRKKKLARLKQDILPAFPGSLVCTRCLHVIKRP